MLQKNLIDLISSDPDTRVWLMLWELKREIGSARQWAQGGKLAYYEKLIYQLDVLIAYFSLWINSDGKPPRG